MKKKPIEGEALLQKVKELGSLVSVHANGQIVIGSTYTTEMALKPGDEFEIKLGYKHIHLKQIEG